MKTNIDMVNENAELKRLLKLIYDENQKLKMCCACVYENLSGGDRICCICGNTNGSTYKWKHADEVMKLLEDKE